MTLVQPGDDIIPVRLGDYLRAIPEGDFRGHDFAAANVDRVYRDPSGRWVHVLLAARSPNVYLVFVVDQVSRSVYGHHVLDLNSEYAIGEASGS